MTAVSTLQLRWIAATLRNAQFNLHLVKNDHRIGDPMTALGYAETPGQHRVGLCPKWGWACRGDRFSSGLANSWTPTMGGCELVDLGVTRSTGQQRLRCPRCEGRSKSLSVEFDRGLYHCFRRGLSGRVGGAPHWLDEHRECVRKAYQERDTAMKERRSPNPHAKANRQSAAKAGRKHK